jgi:beta-xylosidase
VTWKNNWPVIGNDADGDGKGEPVLVHKKPAVQKAWSIATPAESDEFNAGQLGLQWQWHANPKITWSALLPGNGFLRLFAVPQPKKAVNLWPAPNLLLQKLPAPSFTATVKLEYKVEWDVWEGKKAGLLLMGNDYAYISIAKKESGYFISQVVCKDALNNGSEQVMAENPITSGSIYLRAVITAPDANCRFGYSEDGVHFNELGSPFLCQPDKWIGTKIGLFCTSSPEVRTGGYADIDWFRITQ